MRRPGDALVGRLFVVGSACFALGSFPPYFLNLPGEVVAWTFFVGSLFFTSAATLQVLQTVADAGWPRGLWQPRAGAWWSAVVQWVGTLCFNVSTYAATRSALDVAQQDRLVWAPDVYGSVAFLVSSGLGYALVRHLARGDRTRSIAALNLAGSAAFGVSAVGAFVLADGDLLDPRWANAGTFVGAVCFLVGAWLLVPRPTPTPALRPG